MSFTQKNPNDARVELSSLGRDELSRRLADRLAHNGLAEVKKAATLGGRTLYKVNGLVDTRAMVDFLLGEIEELEMPR